MKKRHRLYLSFAGLSFILVASLVFLVLIVVGGAIIYKKHRAFTQLLIVNDRESRVSLYSHQINDYDGSDVSKTVFGKLEPRSEGFWQVGDKSFCLLVQDEAGETRSHLIDFPAAMKGKEDSFLVRMYIAMGFFKEASTTTLRLSQVGQQPCPDRYQPVVKDEQKN